MRIWILLLIINISGCTSSTVYNKYFKHNISHLNNGAPAFSSDIVQASISDDMIIFCVKGKLSNHKSPKPVSSGQYPAKIIEDTTIFTVKTSFANNYAVPLSSIKVNNLTIGCSNVENKRDLIKILKVKVKNHPDGITYVMEENNIHDKFILINTRNMESFYIDILDDGKPHRFPIKFQSEGEVMYADYMTGSLLMPFAVTVDVVTLPLQAIAYLFVLGTVR
jgi:hypothetical protein